MSLYLQKCFSFQYAPLISALHTLPLYFEWLIFLILSWLYLLSHVLFKSNITFQEFSLLSSWCCSESCPPGLSAESSWWKVLESVKLRKFSCCFHIWMTAWLDIVVRVIPWSVENTQDVNLVTFEIHCGELLSSPSPCLENCSPRSLQCW